MFVRLSLALAVAAVAFAAGSALAEDTPMEAKYRAYQEALDAVKRCRKTEFTPAQHNAIGEEINVQIEGEVGAGRRLTIIEEAKRRMYDLTFKRGCDDSEVMERLALFDSDLAPALARLESN